MSSAFGGFVDLKLVSIQSGQVTAPRPSAAAQAGGPLDVPQRYTQIGEPIPVVFARFRNSKGGVLVSPGATEARFESDGSYNFTASYHLVISDGLVDSIPVKDVQQGPCRVGTHIQNYGIRAGTWTPGNYITAPFTAARTAPLFGGSVGAYPDMSTLSFQVTVGPGLDTWKRQVHLFIRGGLNVTRLYDGVTGPSDNFADLVKWLIEKSSRVPASLIDTAALTTAATFLEYNQLTCNCNLQESTNLPDLLARWAPYFLLCESNLNGKRGLRPLLPTLASGAINTGTIVDEYTFVEDMVLPGTVEIQYNSLTDRQPFVAQVIWRQQLEGDIGIIRTAEVKYVNTASEGPYETYDLSEFCTNEDHAVKVGTYILARRMYSTHTIRFSARPQAHNAILTTGSIIRVKLAREATNYVASSHDYLYQVASITETLAGDVSYEAVHFPIDSQGRSLIALDVAAAVGTGVIFPSYRTGASCDINSSTDGTIPGSTGLTPSSPSTDSEPIEVPPSGTGTGGTGGTGGGFGSSPPTTPPSITDDNVDGPLPVITPGPTNGAMSDPLSVNAGSGDAVQWYRDGAPISGATGRLYTPTGEDVGSSLTATVAGKTSAPLAIYGVNPEFTKDGGIYATVTFRTFGNFTRTSCSTGNVVTDLPNDPSYTFTKTIGPFVKLWTYTDDGAGGELEPVIQWSVSCGAGNGGLLRRNGYYTRVTPAGGVITESLWGGNIQTFSVYEDSALHGTIIESIVLTQANPSYGQIGDNVLSLGVIESIANGGQAVVGSTNWSKGIRIF